MKIEYYKTFAIKLHTKEQSGNKNAIKIYWD